MKITKRRLAGGSLVLLLVGCAWLVGCGNNAADTETADGAAPAADAEQAATDEKADLEAQQRDLEERLAEVEAREAELARREAAATKRTETPRTTTTKRKTPLPPPAEPVSRTVSVTLPASTALQVEFAEGLSSEESAVGDPVRAFVVQDVVRDGIVAVPTGSEVQGQVVEVRAGKKIGGQAKLALGFQTLRLPSGDELAIQSSIEFVGKKQTGKDAATIGGSAAGGAILGRVLGGDDKDKATAIGAVVGAAVGTAVAANNKVDAAVVEKGQVTEVLLYEPLHLTVQRDAPASSVARR
jgi:hypothetical protein